MHALFWLVRSSSLALQPFAPPPQQLDHGHERDRDREQNDGGSRDRRCHRLGDAAEDLARQGPQFRAADEERDHDLVERGREGEDRAREDPGKDEREGDLAEGEKRRRAETCGRSDHVVVEALERRRHRDHHERKGEQRVRQNEAGQRSDERQRREEIVERQPR